MSARTERGGATVRLGPATQHIGAGRLSWERMLDHERDGRPHVKTLDWNENADDLIFVFADNQTGARCGGSSGAYQKLSGDFASSL